MKVALQIPKIRLPRLNDDLVWYCIVVAITFAAVLWIASNATPHPSVTHCLTC